MTIRNHRISSSPKHLLFQYKINKWLKLSQVFFFLLQHSNRVQLYQINESEIMEKCSFSEPTNQFLNHTNTTLFVTKQRKISKNVHTRLPPTNVYGLSHKIIVFSYIIGTWHIMYYKATLGKTSPIQTGLNETARSTRDISAQIYLCQTILAQIIVFANGQLSPPPTPSDQS